MKKVISTKNLRTKSPIISALVIYLCLDKWNAPQWIYGVFGVLFFILFVAWIIDLFNTKEVDIFENELFKN